MANKLLKLSSAGAALGLFAAAASGTSAYAQSVVSACSGVSLPPSVVTQIMGPVVGGVVQPLENGVNALLGALTPLLGSLLPAPVSVDSAGLLSDAAAGNPVTLSALDVNGVVVGPSDNCITTSDVITLDDQAGIAIGGNQITGLGRNGETAAAGELDSIALGNRATTSAAAASAIAIGTDATVLAGGRGSLAIGAEASASSANSVALGAGSVADDALGAPAYNPGGLPLAGATPVGEVSIGDAGLERRLTNLAAGSADTDAVNVGQLRALADWSIRYDGPARDVATLAGASGTRITNLSDGLIGSTSTDAVNGSQLYATNRALDELSRLAVVYDVDGNGDRTNSVSLRGGDESAPVRVRNVARGEEETDAVNVAQLDDGLAGARDYARSLSSDSYERSKAYTDSRVGEVRGEARQAAAIGLAAASLRFDGTPGKFSVGASGGVWRGEAAFAVGFGYTSETGRLRANATATTADGSVGAGGGLSFTLN